MSFWPFPKNLRTELLGAAACGPAIELGAGRGELARRLREIGLEIVTTDVDLLAPVDVIADLRRIPLADRTAGLLVLGDVLRHLDPVSREEAAAECARVLAPGGRVVVLEDHPAARDEAERNYREVLALLADFAPGRGPARSLERLTVPWRSRIGPPILHGEHENEIAVDDAMEPVRWLRTAAGSDREVRRRLDDLSSSIASAGMRYGRYCFEVYTLDSDR